MTEKYPILKALIWVFRVLALLCFLIGVVIGGLTLMAPNFNYDYSTGAFTTLPTSPAQIVLGVALILGGIIMMIVCLSAAELIRIQIANARQIATQTALLARIEKNSQRPLDALREIRN